MLLDSYTEYKPSSHNKANSTEVHNPNSSKNNTFYAGKDN